MMHSVEVRSPFVDHRLLEYILSCRTESIKYKNPKEYVIEILSEDFNNEFLHRKKMGFVFDLEKIIYENELKIKDIINFSEIKKFIPDLNINKLFLRKSRINSQRIYKLLILAHFIKNK